MNLYTLNMKLKYGDGYLQYKKNRFVLDNEFPNLIKAVNESDILRVLTGGYLFSRKIRDLLIDNEEFLFEESIVINECSGDILSTDLFKVNCQNKIKLVDYNKSKITGNPFYEDIIILKENIPKNSMVVMDEKDNSYIYYTSNFINLIKEYNLEVDFEKI